MDYKFLDKVVDQIISETKRFFPPYSPSPFPVSLFTPIFPLFSKHCEEIYGLNPDEIKYVWYEHKQIIKDKIYSYG